jgi:MFS family permease
VVHTETIQTCLAAKVPTFTAFEPGANMAGVSGRKTAGSVAHILCTVLALFIGAALMIAACALLGTVVAVRATVENFGPGMTGVVMAAFSVGFIAGTIAGPHLIDRAGHIRTFAAASAVASALAIAFTFRVDPFTWTVVRVLMGVCIAGLYLVIESWLNGASTDATRGRLFSIYMVIQLASLAGGQPLLNFASPLGFGAFALGSVLLSLAIVPVVLTRTVAPMPPRLVPVSIRRLYRISPLAFLGALSAGFTLGAINAMAPVYLQALSFGVDEVVSFMAALYLGGLALQWPAGWLSDRLGRRCVLVGTSIALGVLSAFLAGLDPASASGLWALAAAFGALAYPIYSLAAAHANDQAGPAEAVATSGGLLLVSSVGSIIGPPLCGIAMNAFGAHAMFVVVAVVQAGLSGFAIYRMSRRPAVPREAQAPFAVTTRASPAAMAEEPRTAGPAPASALEAGQAVR